MCFCVSCIKKNKKALNMGLQQELQHLSRRSAQKDRAKNVAKAKKAERKKRRKEKEQAQSVLEALPENLKEFASSQTERKYEVMQFPGFPTCKVKELKGLPRLIYMGCKEMGLDVYIGYSEFDDGMQGVPCLGIWVKW